VASELTSAQFAALPSAGLFRRFAALLYDSFLVGAIWMLLGFILQLIVGPDTNSLIDGQVVTDPVLDNILFPAMVLSCSGFYIWFWRRSGQTLGMIAWRIKLQNSNGNLVSIGQAIARFLLAWPAFWCLGLGYLWLFIDNDKLTVHDKLTDTKVVLLPKEYQPLQ
jgi:uncharacterized RDD family membrane protein YckC